MNEDQPDLPQMIASTIECKAAIKERAQICEKLRQVDEALRTLGPLTGQSPESKRARAFRRAELIEEKKRLETRNRELRDIVTGVGAARVFAREREELRKEIANLERRLEASAERREEALKVLRVFVATDDNTDLTEDEYEARMDACVKRARTILSLEDRNKE